ncbi:BAR/IMD domain-containing adapter protein 2-like 2 [Osmerus mordax]|uniref:BAR/IMD domain-containing adapter protein 2-like 2 n=1 Tax=Osmerus mordax TaxID=8014 RepID=UPI0035100BAA
MSGLNSDQLHRSTLAVYASLTDQFNPSLQKLVSLGNNYIQAFHALAATSETYFSALAKIGEQALHTLSSRPIGDVLLQISENQRRLTSELEGVFCWFQHELIQEMDNNVKLDKDYISNSRRRYEMEVRSQASGLERQLRRGAHQDGSEYISFLRESQREALREEERRYRFLAEKHCDLTQSFILLMNKTGVPLQQTADDWKDQVDATRGPRAGSSPHLEQDSKVGMREEERWSRREDQPLGRVPSRGPSPQGSRSRAGSVGDSLGLGGGRAMRALVAHPASSNPTLLAFSRGELISVLVPAPRNGWLYGRAESSLSLGWFPATYVQPLEEAPRQPSSSSGSTLRSSSSMSNLLDHSGGSNHGGGPPPPPPLPNRQTEMHPITPTHERRTESLSNKKRPEKSGHPPELFPKGTNPFATVKLKPTSTNDRSAPKLRR